MYSIVLFLFIRILYAQGRTLFARIYLASQIFRLPPHWIYTLLGKTQQTIPLHLIQASSSSAKSLSLFAIYVALRDRKAVQI